MAGVQICTQTLRELCQPPEPTLQDLQDSNGRVSKEQTETDVDSAGWFRTW
ncbi:hypothetical protein PAMP_005417 [Pampus punctatissimus]